MKRLYLLPNTLHEQSDWKFAPPSIDALIAESEKGGRLYLKRFCHVKLPIYLLNEHTKNLSELLNLKEENVGLISDAGMPCLADPGAALVLAARQKGVEIQTFPGPSSLLMALILSGFSGQSFTFHGYLNRNGAVLAKQIRSFPRNITHIFIETPYRNDKMIEYLLKNLSDDDLLCIACNLTGRDEKVVSYRIKDWKAKQLPGFDKKPAVFLVSRADL